MAESIRERVCALDWREIGAALLERGHARTGPLLDAGECGELIAFYRDPSRFRRRVDMERHRFGRGDYAYFARPLPRLVQSLRTHLYRRLAPIANDFSEQLGGSRRYPPTLRAFLARCTRAGQRLPTPLVLHYEAGGYNRLHQDLYGREFFPLQAAIALLPGNTRRAFATGVADLHANFRP